MSLQKFLICDSEAHSHLVDHLAMEFLRETQNSQGANWSGTFYEEKTDRFAVLWCEPLKALFGEDPALQVVEGSTIARDKDGKILSGTWERWQSPEPDAPFKL